MQGAPASLAALLAGAIDYAGLFPPASLAMAAAVAQYDRHRVGPHRGGLGRFVLAAPRLDELAEAARSLPSRVGDAAGSWPLSVLIAPPFEADGARVARFNERHAGAAPWRARVEAVEAKAATPDDVWSASRTASGLELFVETPIQPLPVALLDAVLEAGARAKIRTGGASADAFPPRGHLAAWLAHAAGLRLPFKATAGLHHPLRAERPLPAGDTGQRAAMHGFLNLMMAAAFLHAGRMDAGTAGAVLDERDAGAFAFSDEGASWRDRRLATPELAAAREFALGFGSCSFDEPVEDLAALGLLATAPPAS